MVAGVISASEEEIDGARGKSEPANRRTEVKNSMSDLTVDKCVLLEGLGPNSRDTSTSCGTLARHISARHKLMSRIDAGKGPRVYESVEAATQVSGK